MMETLEKLFGSSEKVKIMKLFLFNPENAFDVGEVSVRSKVSHSLARREIINLEKAGFLKRRTYSKDILRQKNRKMAFFKKRANGYMLNYKFAYLEPLYNFLSELNVQNPEELIE